MRIVCISDTHLTHDEYRLEIPDGDILIHSGDATFRGTREEIDRFSQWLYSLPHKNKIFVAGNHDWLFETNRAAGEAHLQGCGYMSDRKTKVCTYLQDSEVTIDGLRIYGAPWSPRFYDWAFNVDRGALIRAKWDKIHTGIDVLITHGPPLGYGDLTKRGEHVGCADLLDAVNRIKPKLHIFGHIHPGYGMYGQHSGGTIFVNASICDESYHPSNAPIIVDL